MASDSDRFARLERMIEDQNRTIGDMNASMHTMAMNNAKTSLAIFAQMCDILTEMKRTGSDVSKLPPEGGRFFASPDWSRVWETLIDRIVVCILRRAY